MSAKQHNQNFGQYIRTARENLGLSQRDAAKLLGVSQSYVHRVESGDRNTDLGVAIELCEKLGVDIIDFAKKYVNENPHE